jgi:hypothetical protein
MERAFKTAGDLANVLGGDPLRKPKWMRVPKHLRLLQRWSTAQAKGMRLLAERFA